MKKYHYFWGGIYSNWHLCPIKIETIITEDEKYVINKMFNCSEQAMMYLKAIVFKDYKTANKILSEDSPKKQKALGRLISNFSNEKWDKVKYTIVSEIVFQKFNQNQNLKKEILSNKCDEFVEASPFDKIWGIGYNEKNATKVPIEQWGQNLLGKIITETRKKLK